jgi:hypothetical protein
MDDTLAGPIIAAKRKELDDAADEILKLSEDIARDDLLASEFKDQIALKEATIRVGVSTAMNKETGRARYPNIDAQNAETLIELEDEIDYSTIKNTLLDTLLGIEIKKAKRTRLEQRRHDVRTEVELTAALLR